MSTHVSPHQEFNSPYVPLEQITNFIAAQNLCLKYRDCVTRGCASNNLHPAQLLIYRTVCSFIFKSLANNLEVLAVLAVIVWV